MTILWVVAISLMLLVSVMTHKGKALSGSTGDGFTVWMILCVMFSTGFVVGIEHEKKERYEYIDKNCFERGKYMICKITSNTDDEPAVSGSKWNEH